MNKTMIAKLCWFMFMAIVIAVSGCDINSGEDDNDNNSDGNGDGNSNSNGMTTLLSPADLLPDDDAISDWQSIGVYDEANDYDELYDLINGGAEVFIDNGFVSAAFQIYINCVDGVCADAAVHVRIYDQESEANAAAVYDRVATGIGMPWHEAGMEARIDESGLAVYTVEFWQRNMYVQVLIEEKSDAALNIAKLFASHVSREIR